MNLSYKINDFFKLKKITNHTEANIEIVEKALSLIDNNKQIYIEVDTVDRNILDELLLSVDVVNIEDYKNYFDMTFKYSNYNDLHTGLEIINKCSPENIIVYVMKDVNSNYGNLSNKSDYLIKNNICDMIIYFDINKDASTIYYNSLIYDSIVVKKKYKFLSIPIDNNML